MILCLLCKLDIHVFFGVLQVHAQTLTEIEHPTLSPDAFLCNSEPPQSPTHAAGPSAGVSDVSDNAGPGTDEELEEPHSKKNSGRTDGAVP